MINRKVVIFSLLLVFWGCTKKKEALKLPNIVFFLADDLGYGDLGCYGNSVHRTPNIDQLAKKGIKLNNFYAAASVCTPTRAALMTGCYPRRVSLHRDSKDHCVLIPGANKGINPDELTLAELLKEKEYATGCFGKWHLGDQKVFLPVHHGFDTYYGIPYSNDMDVSERGDPPLPVIRDDKIIESGTNQDSLTWKTATEAIKFIKKNQSKPFFVYIPFHMPHNPIHASDKFKGKSDNGIYGDAIEEIDYSVGRILNVLDSLDKLDNTIIVFTSDNGAARPFGGSNQPLSGWKGGNQEGGFRVPCIIQWACHIEKESYSDSFSTIMDFLPTLAEITGYELPKNRKIDGISVINIWLGKSMDVSNREFYYYYRDQLQAVRKGNWKLFLPLEIKQVKWNEVLHKGPGQEMKLVNLANDLQEMNDVSSENPRKVEELMFLAEKVKKTLGDNDKQGIEQRSAGWLDDVKYLRSIE